MDRKQAQALLKNIDLVKAFAEGQTIEVRRVRSTTWYGVCNPTFDFTEFDYRIKPRPFEGWVNVYEDGSSGAIYGTKTKALAVGAGARRTVFVREVEGQS